MHFSAGPRFLALVVKHVGQRHSLRDIESVLMNDPPLRYHLDLGTRAVSCSVVARRNENLMHHCIRLAQVDLVTGVSAINADHAGVFSAQRIRQEPAASQQRSFL